MHARASTQSLGSKNAERSERSVSEVRATPQWKMPVATQHTHTLLLAHTSDREAPHMGFSSEASCSTAQWALPLIVTARHSLYHSHYFGGMFWTFFYPYHRQTSSPSPRTHAFLKHKTIKFKRSVTCRLSITDPITQHSFTFRLMLCYFSQMNGTDV